MNINNTSSMEEQARQLYNKVAPSYDDAFNVPYRRLYDETAWEITQPYIQASRKHNKVLDAGGGIGRWAIRVAQLGFRVTLYDLSPAMCKGARESAREAKLENLIEIIEGDQANIDANDGQFDFVVAMGSFQYSSNPGKVLKEWNRVLRPGGRVAVLVDGKFARVYWVLINSGPLQAMELLESNKTTYCEAGVEATLHLFSLKELSQFMVKAGFEVELRAGFVALGHTLPRDELNKRIMEDFESWKRLEQRISTEPGFADMGRQILVISRKPD